MDRDFDMKRSEIYQAVWSEPVFHVAKRLGMSDRGLSDICKRFDVPTPPRGFWRKVQAGQKPPVAPLPLSGNDPDVLRGVQSCVTDGASTLPLVAPVVTVVDASVNMFEAELELLNSVGAALVSLGKMKSAMGPEMRAIARRWLSQAASGL